MIAARYRLNDPLGQGGMGVVWDATRMDTGEKVAIKLLQDDANDAESRRRFLREARAAQVVQHPHVVRILEVLELDDGSPAIVMEHLEGESLGDKLQRDRSIALPELATLLVPVVSAIGTAHALGVVHRDLKPENIFLCHDAAGEIVTKVLDFGIAKLTTLDDESMLSTVITTGRVLGTPPYMAPEQVFGECDIDHRADVWALGLILYHCLSGVLPTKGQNVGQVLKHVLAKPFNPIDQLVLDLPDDVSHLIMHMLARERELRPADLRETLQILEAYTTCRAPEFGPPPQRLYAQPAAAPPAAPQRRPVAAAASSASARGWARHRNLVRGIAAATVLLGVGLVPLLAGSQTATSPLASLSTVLACPILRTSGDAASNGWLGAAAAATACERARLVLGGRPARTLAPAALLDLPATPVGNVSVDPFGAPDARDRSLAAARQRAAAYLDGAVETRESTFTVVLELRNADGTELARGQGEAQSLDAAVRTAMAPLIGPTLIPEAADPGADTSCSDRPRCPHCTWHRSVETYEES